MVAVWRWWRGAGLWLSYESALKKANITLDQVAQNPVDTAWGANKPNPPMTDVNALELKYSGRFTPDE